MPLFQQILALSLALQARNWVPQPTHTNVAREEARFFATFQGQRGNVDVIFDCTGFGQNLRQEPASNTCLFIGRKPDRSRSDLNSKVLPTALDESDFANVECDELNVHQQPDVFQRADHVIGSQGAGLTNIVFR